MKRIKTKHGLHICKYLEIGVHSGGRGVALFTETFRFHLAKNILFCDSPSKYLFSLTFVFLILQKGAFFCLHLRKVVNKKKYFTTRLLQSGPPPYGQVFCDSFLGVHLTSVYDYIKTNFDTKKPFFLLFGWVKMFIVNRSKHDNGTKKAMMRSALNMFKIFSFML